RPRSGDPRPTRLPTPETVGGTNHPHPAVSFPGTCHGRRTLPPPPSPGDRGRRVMVSSWRIAGEREAMSPAGCGGGSGEERCGMASGNWDTRAALTFHNATKYLAVPDATGTEQILMGTPPALEPPIWEEDWSLEPFPFKIYETLDPIEIPR